MTDVFHRLSKNGITTAWSLLTSQTANQVPLLLGLKEFPCEDSARRAFQRGDHEKYTLWMDQSLNHAFERKRTTIPSLANFLIFG